VFIFICDVIQLKLIRWLPKETCWNRPNFGGRICGAAATANLLFSNANPSRKSSFAIAKQESDYPVGDSDAAEQRYSYSHVYTKFDKEGITPGCHSALA